MFPPNWLVCDKRLKRRRKDKLEVNLWTQRLLVGIFWYTISLFMFKGDTTTWPLFPCKKKHEQAMYVHDIDATRVGVIRSPNGNRFATHILYVLAFISSKKCTLRLQSEPSQCAWPNRCALAQIFIYLLKSIVWDVIFWMGINIASS